MILNGNTIKTLSLDNPVTLADHAYSYEIFPMAEGSQVTLEEHASMTVYFYSTQEIKAEIDISAQTDAALNEKNRQMTLVNGGALQLENARCQITCRRPGLVVFVAGTKHSYTTEMTATFADDRQIKYVSKPWGYEMWLNGEHPLYSIKRIYIKNGNQTSLQYHEKKRETNLLFTGEASLSYYNSECKDLANADLSRIEQIHLQSLTCIDVEPMSIHRLKANSDILLFEVSTPHLDDVIRLDDCTGRKNGRISAEHE
ncbi:hypothetical protein SG34_031195 [Thalassomonas viridans]|uniref:Uncharacterized protein n=1 Tax=Thalassomonas viridans TaxID=137584 RepID=A0AAE9Z9K2_9GAMM|nr:hypothetical protein [Thalassomonas viridans]WDE09231.1 hypothetical protein SG34_031195 [Thalassomonas viridans]